MKTLRAIGAGFIILTLSFIANAETKGSVLEILITEQFTELTNLDLSGVILAQEKETISKKSIAYGHDHEGWYETNKSFQRYIHYVKAVIADLNTRCKTTPAPMLACEQEEKFIDTYDPVKAQEFYKKLADAKLELDSQRAEILGKLAKEGTTGTIGTMGGNNIAGLAYLEKREIIVVRIKELQSQIKILRKEYTPAGIPNPKWSLF